MVFKEIVLGRIIVGLGIGLASACIPLYLSELSPAKYRGRIVASLVVLITGGECKKGSRAVRLLTLIYCAGQVRDLRPAFRLRNLPS